MIDVLLGEQDQFVPNSTDLSVSTTSWQKKDEDDNIDLELLNTIRCFKKFTQVLPLALSQLIHGYSFILNTKYGVSAISSYPYREQFSN